MIVRKNIAENTQLHTRCANVHHNKPSGDNINQSLNNTSSSTPQKGRLHTGYRTYKEWVKLTPEQGKEILQQHSLSQLKETRQDGSLKKINNDGGLTKKHVTFTPQETQQKT